MCRRVVDGYSCVVARLDGPVELSEIHQNVGFKSAVPNVIRMFFRRLCRMHQCPPQVAGQSNVASTDQIIEVGAGVTIAEQRLTIDLTEHRSGFQRPRVLQEKKRYCAPVFGIIGRDGAYGLSVPGPILPYPIQYGLKICPVACRGCTKLLE